MPEKTGRAKGGLAVAAKMTPEQLKERAMKGVEARKEKSSLPKASHVGELVIGDTVIQCAVLSDGTRLISERGVVKALGGKRGGSHWKRKKENTDGANLPIYVSAKNILPFISEELSLALTSPIEYKTGSVVGYGLKAELLPQVCDVWLKARDAGKVLPSQDHIAVQADILMRGLAHVGIIALVDEATGYQDVRARNELNIILQAYIAKELLPWTKRFPDEFYKQIFRLHGWGFNPMSVKRPGYVGTLTNKLVYERLPAGVLEELRKINPPNESGNRRHRHHQFLSENIGNPHLEKHIASVTTLMRISESWDIFIGMFLKAFPASGDQQPLFPEDEKSGYDDI